MQQLIATRSRSRSISAFSSGSKRQRGLHPQFGSWATSLRPLTVARRKPRTASGFSFRKRRDAATELPVKLEPVILVHEVRDIGFLDAFGLQLQQRIEHLSGYRVDLACTSRTSRRLGSMFWICIEETSMPVWLAKTGNSLNVASFAADPSFCH